MRVFICVCVAALLVGCGDDDWDLTDPTFVWEPWDGCDGPAGDPAHPRPDFRRALCQSLNGPWQFQLDPDDVGLDEDWYAPGRSFSGFIQVPYPWTSDLSGVGEDTGDSGGIGWYRRAVQIVPLLLESNRRFQLVIGAADWHTTVWVNGAPVAEHDNGYLPLRADVTDALVPGQNEIVVRVQDPGNDAEYPHGKQGWPWYTNVGGIWQTVYLEVAGKTSLERLTFLPQASAVGDFRVQGRVTGPLGHCVLRLYRPEDTAPLARFKITRAELDEAFSVPDLSPWSPADPQRTELEARLTCDSGEDAVRTYLSWRTVARGPVPGQGYEAIQLNGEPVYIRGVLVQGYNPDGLYTYPDEARMRSDLQAAKAAGYNLVRLHIKAEDPVLLHLADELGLLVDYDVPCYSVFPFATGDTDEARARWLDTLEGMIRRDANHPSVLWWTLWNEDWGLAGMDEEYDAEKQAFVRETVARARELDPTRLVEDHSTVREDHVAGTDVNSFHLYSSSPAGFEQAVQTFADSAYVGSAHNYVPGNLQDGAPLLNTEYGPFSYELQPEWQTDRDVSFGMRFLTSILRRYPPVVGYVFTELYDVEFEHNGLADYDRTVKETGYPQGITVADLNGADHVGFEAPWFQITQGRSVTVTPFVTGWSDAVGQGGERVRLQLYDVDDAALGDAVELPAAPERCALEVLDPVTLPVPAQQVGVAYVLAEWMTSDGSPLAINYLPGEVVAATPLSTVCDGARCEVVLNLGECTGDLDPDTTATVGNATQAVGLLGEGSIHCVVHLPAQVRDATTLSVLFDAEMAANVPGAPQTTAGGEGGAVHVLLGGQAVDTLPLPPDRADSRGVLSHLNGPRPAGGFGARLVTNPQTLSGPLGDTTTLTLSVSGAEANGVILYGARLGRYARPPVVTLYY